LKNVLAGKFVRETTCPAEKEFCAVNATSGCAGGALTMDNAVIVAAPPVAGPPRTMPVTTGCTKIGTGLLVTPFALASI